MLKRFFLTLMLVPLLHAHAQPETADTQWFEDARFGMFIHFGLYSIPGGVWQDEAVKRNGYAEWIQYQHRWPALGGIPAEDYQALAKQFNPTGFDPDAWVSEAKRAGMKYLLITAKHHDGFALWDSQVSDFTVTKATPFKRDILAELAQACRKQGLKLGFYYSHWQDWRHHGGALPPWPEIEADPAITQPSDAEFETYWNETSLPQVKELLENFSPDFFWFDSWGKRRSQQLTEERLQQLISLVRSIRPTCLINSRIGTETNVDYLSMSDNHFPEQGFEMPWETSGTLNHSWGYHRLDYHWKPTADLLRHLVDNASRGGNYQLNVGPTADGKFQAAASRRLKEIGAWMDINGEAIQGTRQASLPEPTWGRFTAKSTAADELESLYALIYDAPENSQISLTGLASAPVSATVLETGETLSFEVIADGTVNVSLPEFLPDERISVIRFDF